MFAVVVNTNPVLCDNILPWLLMHNTLISSHKLNAKYMLWQFQIRTEFVWNVRGLIKILMLNLPTSLKGNFSVKRYWVAITILIKLRVFPLFIFIFHSYLKDRSPQSQHLVLLAHSSRREIERSLFVLLLSKGTAWFIDVEGWGKDWYMFREKE